MAQWTISLAVYLYIVAFEVNVLNCRRAGDAVVLPTQSEGRQHPDLSRSPPGERSLPRDARG